MIAGCGGASTGVPLARGDATRLRRELAAIRAAAAAHDPGKAHRAVATLRSDIDQLLRAGRLSTVDGRSMLAVLARADSKITGEVHPAPPSVSSAAPAASSSTPSASLTTPSTPTRSPPGPPAGHGHGKSHGHGHGKDRGRGHGKDHGHGHDHGGESGGD